MRRDGVVDRPFADVCGDGFEERRAALGGVSALRFDDFAGVGFNRFLAGFVALRFEDFAGTGSFRGFDAFLALAFREVAAGLARRVAGLRPDALADFDFFIGLAPLPSAGGSA